MIAPLPSNLIEIIPQRYQAQADMVFAIRYTPLGTRPPGAYAPTYQQVHIILKSSPLGWVIEELPYNTTLEQAVQFMRQQIAERKQNDGNHH